MQEVQVLVFYVQWSLSGLIRTNGHALLTVKLTPVGSAPGSTLAVFLDPKEIRATLVKHLGLTRGNPYEFKNGRTGVELTAPPLTNPQPYQIPN